MTSTSSNRSDRRAQQKAERQRKAHRRRIQRLTVRYGALVGVAIIAGLGILWWRAGDDGGDGAAAGQALHQFDTADFHSLAFDPTDENSLYFGHHYGIKVSVDGGETWEDGALRDVDVMQQASPPANPDRRYAAGHDVFQVSNDGGQTWQPQPNDLPALDIHGFAAAPTDADRLYAFEVVSRGFYTSADGGSTWETLPLPPGMATANLPLAVAYDDPLHLFAGVGNQVLESRDGGRSWEAIEGAGGDVVAIAAVPNNPNAVFVGTVQGIARYEPNTGWQELPLTSDGAVLAIAVHPTQPDTVGVVDQQGNFYRSDDGGQTWAAQ